MTRRWFSPPQLPCASCVASLLFSFALAPSFSLTLGLFPSSASHRSLLVYIAESLFLHVIHTHTHTHRRRKVFPFLLSDILFLSFFCFVSRALHSAERYFPRCFAREFFLFSTRLAIVKEPRCLEFIRNFALT